MKLKLYESSFKVGEDFNNAGYSWKVLDTKGDYTLIYAKDKSVQPYVVAWKLFSDGSWAQGHYFEDEASARKYLKRLKESCVVKEDNRRGKDYDICLITLEVAVPEYDHSELNSIGVNSSLFKVLDKALNTRGLILANLDTDDDREDLTDQYKSEDAEFYFDYIKNESLKEGLDDYKIVNVSFDIAIPNDKNLDSNNRRALYQGFSNMIQNLGYEMAGDYMEVEDGDHLTQIYRDNGYEFFGEEESLKESIIFSKETPQGKVEVSRDKDRTYHVLVNGEEHAWFDKDDLTSLKYYLKYKKDISDEDLAKTLEEDTVQKSNGKWTNRGKDGTEHGEFDTKAEADAQRKAMFATGYHESIKESFGDYSNKSFSIDLTEDDLNKFKMSLNDDQIDKFNSFSDEDKECLLAEYKDPQWFSIFKEDDESLTDKMTKLHDELSACQIVEDLDKDEIRTQLDKFTGQITVEKEDESAMKELLDSKGLKYVISPNDDKLTFNIQYSLEEGVLVDDPNHKYYWYHSGTLDYDKTAYWLKKNGEFSKKRTSYINATLMTKSEAIDSLREYNQKHTKKRSIQYYLPEFD